MSRHDATTAARVATSTYIYTAGLLVMLLLAGGCSGDASAARDGLSPACLGCLCEAASNCNRTLQCAGDVCGLFRITWAYWADAGKPVQPGDTPDAPHAFSACVNEPHCAARAVTGYMAKYEQDCTGDGRVDCSDYARLHKLGGYGCRAPLPDYFADKFERCMAQVEQQQQHQQQQG